MKEVPSSAPETEFVRLFSDFASRSGLSMHADGSIGAFTESVASATADSVSNHTRLRGLRHEQLFQAVVVGLGRAHLLAPLDARPIFFTGDDLAPPDFLVMPDATTRWAVEVKSHRQQGDLFRPFRISDNYLQRLRRYADAVGMTLKFAVYWEEMAKWTLVGLEAFDEGARGQERWSLDFRQAFAANEMGMIGDRHVATLPPLRFRVDCDAGDNDEVVTAQDGFLAKMTIRSASLASGDQILSGQGLKIAWQLILHGDWSEEGDPRFEYRNSKVHSIEMRFQPPEGLGQEGPAIIGSLSSLLSRIYVASAGDDLQPRTVHDLLGPGAIGKFIPDDFVKLELDLPLWLFHLKPNYDLARRLGKKAEVP